MPKSLEKETALVPKGRAQARLLDTGLLLNQGKGCLLIPFLPEDLHHLGENFVDVEFTWPCHWAPPFILHAGSYQFFTARSRIKIPAPRKYFLFSRGLTAGTRYFREKYYRLKARRGHKRAVVAVAHKILIAIYPSSRS